MIVEKYRDSAISTTIKSYSIYTIKSTSTLECLNMQQKFFTLQLSCKQLSQHYTKQGKLHTETITQSIVEN